MDDRSPAEGGATWERRKTWPLLLGGAVTLTGLASLNYSWANPDGRLEVKAQKALSTKFPDAEVRVHGRDAIITGLPPGADVDAAHDLVRSIDGVRNVKEAGFGTPSKIEPSVSTDPGESVVRDSRADATVVVTTVVASVDAALGSPTTGVEVAPEVAATEAPTTVAATTVATAPATAVPTTAAPSTVAPTTAAPAAVAPTTVTPTTVAPTTAAPAAVAPTTVATAPADSTDGAANEAGAPPMRILFGSVSSDLFGESQAAVDQLIAYLEANPDVRIKVVGHADAWGTRLTNIAVSRARAGSVVSALVAGGIDRGRMSAFAHGDRVPVASNATAEGRAANRRVQIVFFGAEGTGDREVAFTG